MAAVAPASADGVRSVVPRFPWRAAWTGLIRQRSTWVLVGIWLAMTAGFGVVLNAVLYYSLKDNPGMSAADVADMRDGILPENLSGFAAGALPFYGGAMMLVIGVIAVGGEYRAGTVRLLYTQGPGRVAVLGAQIAALVGVLGIAVVATYVVDYLGLVVVAAVSGWPVGVPAIGPTLVSMAGSFLIAVAYGLVGAALAVITRGTVWSLSIGLVWVLAAETALAAIGHAVSWLAIPVRLLLAEATSTLAVACGAYPWWPGGFSPTASAGEGWGAAGVLTVWAAVALAAMFLLVQRRDID
ncbi:MAG: ABC transporter permease [Bifidobacteriaceae bacterium]|nr:ABC transporter permease [Bifidobacteriaceae bacterium]